MKLIDADALKELITEDIQNGGSDIDFDRGFECGLKEAIEFIDNAPTVNTTCRNCDSGYAQGYSDGYLIGKEERPTGYWRLKTEWHNHRYYGCSNCGREISSDLLNIYIKYPKCPYCNADMKEAEND